MPPYFGFPMMNIGYHGPFGYGYHHHHYPFYGGFGYHHYHPWYGHHW